MKLYSPEDGVKVNVDKDQAEVMISAGWTKTPPKKKEAVETSDENPEVTAEKESAPAKPAPISRKKRISKIEE